MCVWLDVLHLYFSCPTLRLAWPMTFQCSLPLCVYFLPCFHKLTMSHTRHISQDTHSGHHGDTAVLQLHGSAALECRDIAIGGKSDGVPEAHWRLHPKLALEGTQGRGGVVRPVTPGTASQTILCNFHNMCELNFGKQRCGWAEGLSRMQNKTDLLILLLCRFGLCAFRSRTCARCHLVVSLMSQNMRTLPSSRLTHVTCILLLICLPPTARSKNKDITPPTCHNVATTTYTPTQSPKATP